MSIWLVALLRWVLLSVNSVEIILNLIYLIVYFGSNTEPDADASRKPKSASSPWLTILTNANGIDSHNPLDKQQAPDAGTDQFDHGYVSDEVKPFDSKKAIQFGRVTTMNHTKGTLKRQPFYKTLPKSLGRQGVKGAASQLPQLKSNKLGPARGSQESLKSVSTSSMSSAASADAPPRPAPPPPPPSIQSTSNSLQTRNQLAISLSVSLYGFFTAQFRLSWLLLLYSLYLTTGIVIWFYSRVYTYSKTRENNHSDAIKMARSLEATPLIRSAPCQSSCVSAALGLLGQNMIDEFHVQLMAHRQDVLDVGVKIILSSSAFLLSSY